MRMYGRIALVTAGMLGLGLGVALVLAVVHPVVESINGQVLCGGAPIARSTVTLWEASAGAPKKLTETKTDEEGRFVVRSAGQYGDSIVYLVATGGEPKANKGRGDNPAIALLTVLGSKPPVEVVINEMTTVASAFTAARFINGESISGNPLGLRIAAGNASEPGGSGDRRVGQSASGPDQQHADHDACELEHAWLAHYRLRHGGRRRLARPLP